MLKWPLQRVNLQKFSGEACLWPLEAFLFSIYFKMMLPKKKTHLKIRQILVPLPRKISDYVADTKTFFKWLFMPFLGLTSLHLVKTQPNSKFHLPHQNFLDPLLSAGLSIFLDPPFEICRVRPWQCASQLRQTAGFVHNIICVICKFHHLIIVLKYNCKCK